MNRLLNSFGTLSFSSPAVISNVTITGNNWAKKGELVEFSYKCSGTPPYNYCIEICHGVCNVTGNERCGNPPYTSSSCDFKWGRYLYDDKPVTWIVVIQNEVSKVVKASVVNIVVDPGNQGQLSVILVPVAFILFSITAVIYGIAYYVQNRRM